MCFNALDRHVEKGNGDRTCFLWEGNDPGDEVRMSYREVLDKVSKLVRPFTAPLPLQEHENRCRYWTIPFSLADQICCTPCLCLHQPLARPCIACYSISHSVSLFTHLCVGLLSSIAKSYCQKGTTQTEDTSQGLLMVCRQTGSNLWASRRVMLSASTCRSFASSPSPCWPAPGLGPFTAWSLEASQQTPWLPGLQSAGVIGRSAACISPEDCRDWSRRLEALSSPLENSISVL